MTQIRPPRPSEHWLQQIFDAKSARRGGVVRRKIRDIEQNIGLGPFRSELKRRGYHAIENGDQVVIFCNNQPIHLIC